MLTTDLPPLFQQFIEERRYLKNVSPNTVEWYLHSFKAFLPQINTTRPETLHASLKQAVMTLAVTVNDYIRAVNAFLRWGKEEGHLPALIKMGYRSTPAL